MPARVVFSPRPHNVLSLLSTAEMLLPVAIVDHVVSVPTCAGTERLTISAMPSWPLVPSPHAKRVEEVAAAAAPVALRTGALLPGQLTDDGQVTVRVPPSCLSIRVKE